MAIDGVSTNSDATSSRSNGIDFNDPYYLSNGNLPHLPLVNHQFTGANFFNWSRSARMALIARNKLQFVDGTLPMPSSTSADYHKWLQNDYMVMNWIINSMEKSIAESFTCVDSSRQLWTELFERYGHTTAPRLYELHKELHQTHQNSSSLTEYYSALKNILEQLRLLEGFPECTCGALAKCTCCLMRKIYEQDQRNKLMQLFAGLNKVYDSVVTILLSSDHLPPVHKAYNTLQQVEQQSKLHSVAQASDVSAFTAVKTFPKVQYQSIKKDFKKLKADLTCEHCKRKGHDIASCFKLVGYPDWWTGSKGKSTTFVRSANHVHGEGLLGSKPQDDGVSSSSKSSIDPVMVSALYNEVMKMVQSKTIMFVCSGL